MKKTIYTLGIALISLLIASCGDKNPVNPTTNENFLSTGSDWITEYYNLDSNGVNIAESKKLDTLTLLEPRLVRGKTAYPLFDGKDTTMYMYFSGKSLYVSSSVMGGDTTVLSFSKIPVEETNPLDGLFNLDWMKIADFDSKLNDTWNIITKDTTIMVDMGGTILPAQLKITINVTNVGNTTYSYMNATAPVSQFKFSMKMNLVAMGGLITVENTMETIFDISYTKGIMQINNLGQVTKAIVMGQEQNEKTPGDITKTIKYTIK